MMKKIYILLIWLYMSGCYHISVPPQYTYQEIKTSDFDIAVWKKITSPHSPYKIYIEGDGYAFNSRGLPTQDPTPKGTLVRELAFSDNSPNVIYLARPCQYIKNPLCRQKYWTTARFAPEVVNAEYEVIKRLAGNHPLILIGFSGGAQIAGLIAATKPDLQITQIITIAGNLDHQGWTTYHHLPALSESMNLADYQPQFTSIPQTHYVGSKDKVIPPHLVKDFINNQAPVITIEGATHNSGWNNIYPSIHQTGTN